jgi:chromosome partitioning protein
MAKLIAVLGSKGGTGKSSVSHLLAHGFGSLPKPVDAIVITTDPEDTVHTIDRRYYTADGRDHTRLGMIIHKLQDQDRLVIVVDGAAGRPAVDQIIGGIADLIVVPFTPARHDVERAARHLEALPEAVGLPNRWPSHPAARAHANKLFNLLPKDRIMEPVQTLGKIVDLINHEEYQRIATSLSRPGQVLALDVLRRIKVHPLDIRRRDAVY